MLNNLFLGPDGRKGVMPGLSGGVRAQLDVVDDSPDGLDA